MSDDVAGRTRAGSGEVNGSPLETLTDELLPALIARLRASHLGELEVRTGEWRVRVRRDPVAGARAAAAAAGEVPEVATADGSVARSPAVGYFTPASGLAVGRSVQAGDLLGSVDVLGISQEVSAPEDGIVSTVLAEDGQAVEYGQAIVEIDPLEPELEPVEEKGPAS